jgi:transposase-like protein
MIDTFEAAKEGYLQEHRETILAVRIDLTDASLSHADIAKKHGVSRHVVYRQARKAKALNPGESETPETQLIRAIQNAEEQRALEKSIDRMMRDGSSWIREDKP